MSGKAKGAIVWAISDGPLDTMGFGTVRPCISLSSI